MEKLKPIAASLVHCPRVDAYEDYMLSIKGRSALTIKEYHYDLVLMLRFMKMRKGMIPPTASIEHVDLNDIDDTFLNAIQLEDLYAFVGWLGRVRSASASTRARKIATLRSFFHYLHTKVSVIDHNPASELESPKQAKRQPKYLELFESEALLERLDHMENSAQNARNYLILVLFLNCGLRLSELCGINIDDIQETRLRVVGKGNKERTVYLNALCLEALERYLPLRPEPKNPQDSKALLISRQGQRLSREAVQRLVKLSLKQAGLGGRGLSVHKLRHTAATLLYRYGQVDVRLLQQLLGHASLSTTEIYTHVDNWSLEQALAKNPLAQHKRLHTSLDNEPSSDSSNKS